jgi:HEPN domain-containing protein
VTAFDEAEFNRWLSQAQHTKASAERDAKSSDFAWSCFKSQQAGEYALKALLRGVGQPGHGHALRRLLSDLSALELKVPNEILESAQLLDRHYVPTRYPDAFPEGSPHEYYDDRAAQEALDAAGTIISWIQSAT